MSTHPTSRPSWLLRVLLVGGALCFTAAACLPTDPPWTPTREDLSPSTGPDPGTCEARHDCPIPK